MGSQAGRNERLLYRTVAAMVMNMQHHMQLSGTPTKMSAIYRVWRQLLEDCMHKAIIKWMVNQRSDKADARAYKFFYMGKMITAAQQIGWFYMSKALTSVMVEGTLRAVSRWLYHMRLGTQSLYGQDVRKWVTPGVLVFLNTHQRRLVRATIALAAMKNISQRHDELFPPTAGEHDAPCDSSDSDSTLSQEHSEAVYAQRMRDTRSAVRYATSVAVLKATWKMSKVRRKVAMDRQGTPTAKGVRRYRSLASAQRSVVMAAEADKCDCHSCT